MISRHMYRAPISPMHIELLAFPCPKFIDRIEGQFPCAHKYHPQPAAHPAMVENIESPLLIAPANLFS